MIMILLALSLITLASNLFGLRADPERLFSKIELQANIHRSELIPYIPEVKTFEDNFIGMGNNCRLGNYFAGVVKGIKKDTIYQFLLVFRDNRIVDCRRVANASFYYHKGTLIEEYVFGQVYVQAGDSCIMAFQETVDPFKIDTLESMFSFEMTNLKLVDTMKYCLTLPLKTLPD